MPHWFKHPGFFIPLTALTVLIGLSYSGRFFQVAKEPVRIEKGIIDLSNWDPGQQELFSLRGELEFYWQDFRVSAPNPQAKPILVQFPNNWNAKGEFPLFGFASYRYVLKKQLGQKITIWHSSPWTASSIYVNRVRINGGGQVGTTPERHVAGFTRPVAFTFPLETTENEVIIEVSNFDLFISGDTFPSLLGGEEALARRFGSIVSRWSILLGSLMILGVYLLILFALRTKDK